MPDTMASRLFEVVMEAEENSHFFDYAIKEAEKQLTHKCGPGSILGYWNLRIAQDQNEQMHIDAMVEYLTIEGGK